MAEMQPTSPFNGDDPEKLLYEVGAILRDVANERTLHDESLHLQADMTTISGDEAYEGLAKAIEDVYEPLCRPVTTIEEKGTSRTSSTELVIAAGIGVVAAAFLDALLNRRNK